MLDVADGSADDERMEEMVAAVDSVLAEVGADELPVEIVLNKIDLVDPLKRRRLASDFPGAPQVSAQAGEGLDELRASVAGRFAERFEAVRLLIPYDAGARRARRALRAGALVDEWIDREEGVSVRAPGSSHPDLRRFAQFLVLEDDASQEARR